MYNYPFHYTPYERKSVGVGESVNHCFISTLPSIYCTMIQYMEGSVVGRGLNGIGNPLDLSMGSINYFHL